MPVVPRQRERWSGRQLAFGALQINGTPGTDTDPGFPGPGGPAAPSKVSRAACWPASKGPNDLEVISCSGVPDISPSPCVLVSPRVPESLHLPAAPRVPATPAARGCLWLLPAHPPRGASGDRWVGPGRQARTSRAAAPGRAGRPGRWGRQAGVTPESSSRQGPVGGQPGRRGSSGRRGRRRPGYRDPSAPRRQECKVTATAFQRLGNTKLGWSDEWEVVACLTGWRWAAMPVAEATRPRG